MKRNFLLATLLLLSLLVTVPGCAGGETVKVYPNTQIQALDRLSEAASTSGDASLLKDEKTYRDYVDFIAADDCNEEFLSALSSYDMSFFEKNMLIVIYDRSPSADYEVFLKTIDYLDSEIRVVLKYKVPKQFTEIEGTTAVIIELPQNGQYTRVTYQTQESR